MSSRILTGDCRAVLATLPAGSVQMVCTSPPYFGLRAYLDGNDPNKPLEIGSEDTPDAYVSALVEVFRGVKRVLHDSGTVFLNLGDCYAGSGTIGRNDAARLAIGAAGGHGGGTTAPRMGEHKTRSRPKADAKPKDLLMIPARVALALQADGWWLRSAIVWHKPSPMPESVTDRPTSSYEMVFMLAKAERYYYDNESIAEPTEYPELIGKPQRVDYRPKDAMPDGMVPAQPKQVIRGATRNARNVWTIATQPYSGAHFATMPPELAERCILAGSRPGDTVLDCFMGAGTTLLVADRLQRDAVGIELNPTYASLAADRITADAPLFAEVAD